jgi:hypothetical protein
MGGNVWNWCSNIYRADAFAERSQSGEISCDPVGPQTTQGEKVIPGDPSPPTVPGVERRVTTGGSFLCHPDYCESDRPSARSGTPPDTGSSHVGFRCAKDAAPIEKCSIERSANRHPNSKMSDSREWRTSAGELSFLSLARDLGQAQVSAMHPVVNIDDPVGKVVGKRRSPSKLISSAQETEANRQWAAAGFFPASKKAFTDSNPMKRPTNG